MKDATTYERYQLILKSRPGLIENVDWDDLRQRDSRVGCGFKRDANLIRGG